MMTNGVPDLECRTVALLSAFRSRPHCVALVASWGILAVGALQGQTDAAAVRFFEEKVRPVLAQKCLSCHNDQAKMSGLSLASRESAMLGGSRGSAVIPGQPGESLLIQAVNRAGSLKMPPTGPLQHQEVAALTEWVRSGAAWTATAGKDIERADASHWSFQAVRGPEPPSVRNEDWVRNPIDRFVLARLEAKQIQPSPEASRRTLIRRASLDLIGLPPSPEEIAQFLADSRPGAYERLVDRLLDSPHYGERWGRHWLDIARYADSNGYSIDGNRSIWRYRDWVIDALNDNMPFDRFVTEQIAGDLLPDPTTEVLVATGFHRNTMINQEGGIDFEQYRVEAVVDRVSTTGAALLGLTIGCARCHDHKFDPISQKDFYQLYAFFNNIDELSGELSVEEAGKREMDPILEFGEPADFARRDAVRRQVSLLEEELAAYRKELDAELADWEQRLSEKERAEIEPHIRQILETPREKRVSLQKGVLDRFFASRDPGWQARRDGLRALGAAVPELESTLIMRELPRPRDAFVHSSGDFTRRGETVHPGTPTVLPPLPKTDNPNRLDLARWLMSSENPLTARVTVNRMWQRYFGLGLVETESDFGSQGTPPSHPQLLDWLASEFVRQDWNFKAMHRLIVTSASYRQASVTRPELSEVDPGNRLLARQNRLRLEAEIIRDAALAASGLLTPKVGGPSVFPPQPEGSGQFTQVDREWKTADGPDRYRRGIYTFFRRSAAYPGLAMFDAPNAQATATRRNRSNTPLQALTLLNDQTQTEFSRALASVTLSQGGEGRSERIRYVFERCLTRLPLPEEEERLRIFLSRMADDFRTHPSAIPAMVGQTSDGDDEPLLAAWTAASRVLLNLDEFVTRQ